MKCEKCESELEQVSNLIEGIDYYYCRKCKTHRRYLLIGKIKSSIDGKYGGLFKKNIEVGEK